MLSERTLNPQYPHLRVDLVAPIEGRSTAFDVTIVHPTNRAMDPCLATKAEQEPCNSKDWGFAPLAFNTYGGMGPASKRALNKIFDDVAAKHASSNLMSSSLWQRVSLGLMKAVTRQFLLGHPTALMD